MTLDMYSEKVADASALIRQVSGKEYFDAFGVSSEGILELFIDCMDAVKAVQAARIAELERENARLDAALDEEIRTRDQYHEWADRLAAEIARYFGVDIGEHSNANNPWEQAYEAVPAEASAPVVEQHSPAVVAWAVTSDNTKGIHKLSIKRESADRKAAVWLEEWPNNPVRVRPLAFADLAPQASDTDKVREAILALPCLGTMSQFAKLDDLMLYQQGHEDALHEAASLVSSMAAQAPVREVPGWVSVDERYPDLTIRDENKVAIENRSIPPMTSSEKVIVCLDDGNRRIDRAVRLDGSEYTFFQSYGARVKYWQELPAGPVQQEGETP